MSTLSNIVNIGELAFPASQSTEEKLKYLLNYAVLAPSSHNTQPWQFTIENDTIYFKADRTRSLSIADPEGRELIISCGTALFNLRIALHHFGYAGKIITFPDPNLPDLLACIQLGNPIRESDEEHMLFKAIQRRHTNRGYFEDWDVPESLLDWLKGDASAEGVWMYKVKCNTKRQLIGDLVVQADHLQMENPDFRRELATWMRKGDSSSHDGIPSYAFGVSQYLDFATPIFALVMRTFNLGNTIAERSRQLVTQSPVIIVLGTSSDTSADWLKVGQALERILLRAETVGLSASFLNQAIQVPSVRNQISKMTEISGFPQIILRMGFGSQVKPTPRRAVDEVVN
jgi:Putative TM nitroreductase